MQCQNVGCVRPGTQWLDLGSSSTPSGPSAPTRRWLCDPCRDQVRRIEHTHERKGIQYEGWAE